MTSRRMACPVLQVCLGALDPAHWWERKRAAETEAGTVRAAAGRRALAAQEPEVGLEVGCGAGARHASAAAKMDTRSERFPAESSASIPSV